MNHKSGHTSKSLLNFISLSNVKHWMGGFYTVKASGIGSAKKKKKKWRHTREQSIYGCSLPVKKNINFSSSTWALYLVLFVKRMSSMPTVLKKEIKTLV